MVRNGTAECGPERASWLPVQYWCDEDKRPPRQEWEKTQLIHRQKNQELAKMKLRMKCVNTFQNTLLPINFHQLSTVSTQLNCNWPGLIWPASRETV